MADESDDDLYGDESATQQNKDANKAEDNSSGDEPMDEESGDDDDDDDDDDDSDSDIDIIIEKAPAPAKPAASPKNPKANKIEAPRLRLHPHSTPSKNRGLQQAVQSPRFSASASQALPFLPNKNTRFGAGPGEDQSDYFNYGFRRIYMGSYTRQRQVAMANTIQGQKNDMAQMQAMMGGGPMPGMPGMGGAPQGNGGPGGAPPTGPGAVAAVVVVAGWRRSERSHGPWWDE
ncbi:hypothetical protein J3E74DRAFT_423252 [Bipolaris maydis]|nr:hypothetical protein J3E74DRAFT_423252 [Bipolaris maydis]